MQDSGVSDMQYLLAFFYFQIIKLNDRFPWISCSNHVAEFLIYIHRPAFYFSKLQSIIKCWKQFSEDEVVVGM